MNDEQLDKMLTEYFAREPKVAFSLSRRFEKRSSGAARRVFIAVPAVCASFALICTGFFMYQNFGEGFMYGIETDDTGSYDEYSGTMCVTSTAEDSTAEPKNSFFIRAYSEEASFSELNETADFARKENSGDVQLIESRFGDDHFWENICIGISPADENAVAQGRAVEGKSYPCLPRFGIQFKVTGDNIDTLSFESERNCRLYYDDYSYLNDPNYTWEEKERIAVEQFNKDNPYYGEDVDYTEFHTVHWYMPAYFLYDEEYIFPDQYNLLREEAIEKARNKMREDLESWTPEEMTELFGDNVTITVRYKDGSTQSEKMKIYFTDKHNFTIEYE